MEKHSPSDQDSDLSKELERRGLSVSVQNHMTAQNGHVFRTNQ